MSAVESVEKSTSPGLSDLPDLRAQGRLMGNDDHPASYWNPQKFVAFDIETHRFISEADQTPRAVCASVARIRPGFTVEQVAAGDPEAIEAYLLYPREEIHRAFLALLDSDSIIVGANLVFDLGVMAKELAPTHPDIIDRIFRKLDRDEVYDILNAQALDAIAGGHLGKNEDGTPMVKSESGDTTTRYGLEVVVLQVLGREDAKEKSAWRERYGELDGVPLERWPWEARQYPIDDVKNPLAAAIAQVTGKGKVGMRAGLPHRNLNDLGEQQRAHFAEHLARIAGMPVDMEEVERYSAEVDAIREAGYAKAYAAGLVRYVRDPGHPSANSDGLRFGDDTKVIKRKVLLAAGAELCDQHDPMVANFVLLPTKAERGAMTRKKAEQLLRGCIKCRGLGVTIPEGVKRTPTGGVSIGREVLEEQEDPDLQALADVGRSDKAAETYIPYLKSNPTLHPKPNVLLVTGRTSYDGPIQQMPRTGRERACFIAGEERKFISADYAGIECVTWAQACIWLLGYSTMGEAIVSGVDIHADMASALMNGALTWQEIKKIAKEDESGEAAMMRQVSKILNFGLPGRMGALRLVLGQKEKGVLICRFFGRTACIRTVVENHKGEKVAVCRECLAIAKDLRSGWISKWREAQPFFDRIALIVDNTGEVPTLVPDIIVPGGVARMRGGVDPSSACNNFFQSLAAVGAKRALYRLTKECWTFSNPALVGWSPRLFIHDEFLSAGPASTVEIAGPEIARIMTEEMRKVVPDVAAGVKVEWKSNYRWTK